MKGGGDDVLLVENSFKSKSLLPISFECVIYIQAEASCPAIASRDGEKRKRKNNCSSAKKIAVLCRNKPIH